MKDGTLISNNTPSAFKIVDRDVFVNICGYQQQNGCNQTSVFRFRDFIFSIHS